MKCQADIYDELQQAVADEPEDPQAKSEELLNKLAQARVVKRHIIELSQQKKQLEALRDAQDTLLGALRRDIMCLMADLGIDSAEADGVQAVASHSKTTKVDRDGAYQAIIERGVQREFMKFSAAQLKQFHLDRFVKVETAPSVTIRLKEL